MEIEGTIVSKNKLKPYLYFIPAIVVFLSFVLIPVIFSFALSFYDFTGYSQEIFAKFTGFDNYERLFKDKYFWLSIRNTIYFVGSSMILQVGISLFIAITIFLGRFKHSVLIRTIIFFPGILAPVSVSLAWRRMLEQDGVINQMLGIDVSWLASVDFAIWCVILVLIWQWVGYNLVIFYAGLQSLDIELLEAADVDGASWFQKIFRIIIPLIKPTIILNVILNLIGSFRAFDIVYVLTRGGPIHNSEVLTTLMYYYSFSPGGPSKMGVGASIAVIMFVIVVFFGIIRMRVIQKKEKVYKK